MISKMWESQFQVDFTKNLNLFSEFLMFHSDQLVRLEKNKSKILCCAYVTKKENHGIDAL